jgi:uncharacterized membrane protein
MKRIAILSVILCACLVSPSWPQQNRGTPHFGKQSVFGHRITKEIPKIPSAFRSPALTVPAAAAQNIHVWDLGTSSDGTWAEAGGINDFGVMVAQGDAADGDNHLFKIELFGPRARQWSDMGALAAYEGWFNWPLIADSGLIVGYAAAADYVHGFVWTGQSGKTDLGALPELGRNNSEAIAVNKLGTLVAGQAWSDTTAQVYPVAWTPSIGWNGGRLNVTWKIHPLPTVKEFPYGFVYGANVFGQMAGAIYNDDGVYVAALWNPIAGGKGWKLIQLPRSKDWPDVAIAGDINEKGEIVGDVLSLDFVYGYSSLWQPVDQRRQTYKLTLLPNAWGLPNGDTAEGINDVGDIVGASWDENFNMVAVRWSTKDLTSVQLLGFPGDWSLAFRVNEFGIATGTYGGGQCANECVAAVQFR